MKRMAAGAKALQRQKSRRDAGATNSRATSNTPAYKEKAGGRYKNKRAGGTPALQIQRQRLKRRGAFRVLLFDQGYYFIVFGHGAGADFCAAERGAGVCEQANFLAIPTLQEGVGEAAHEGVPGAGGVNHVHFESGNFGNYFGSSN